MPFTPYKNLLSPYDLAAAQDAFDVAWAETFAEDPHNKELARRQLAQWIVAGVVEKGIHDPERLKDHARKWLKP